MEEFNRNSVKIEADEDMIIPTKTMDITQIKGWRTKFFAPESQFHLLSNEMFEELKTKDSNQEDKVTANHLNETENKSNEKKELHSEAGASETKKSPTSTKCNAEELSKDKNDHHDNSSSDSEEDEKKTTRFKEVKDEGNKNPLSPFISEELDNYLKNSATLNISLLQKINPNIIPIPKDAKILSVGKLRKIEDPPPAPHFVFKRKSDSFNKVENNSVESITLDDTPTSPNIITLDESSEESDEDIPVATLLKCKKKAVIKRESLKGCKRHLESESEASAKRLILRLTKEGSGVSKGYKVSDISCKKEKSASTSRASSPSSGTSSLDLSENIIIPVSRSLPIVKKTLFTEKSEKRLVNEFLNNLNMYGTRKDVAMLVQFNQSYFDDGPTLTRKICAKAVTALVSNKEYFEEKQKSKKKLKTWQKYLPQKIDKENMKMKLTKRRKSQIDILLNDAESMIPAERGKRSIRLPARYLDSAVLAASEWVSPVLTIDGTLPIKPKQEPMEDLDKSNLSDEKNIVLLSPPSSTESSSSSSDSSSEDIVIKPPIKLPQKRSIKIKKTQVKKKKLKDSPNKLSSKADAKKSISQTNNSQLSTIESSSTDSSDEDVVESVNNKNKAGVVSKKITPGKRKKSESIPVKSSNSAEKALTENVSATKRQKNKATEVKEIVLDFSPEASPSTKVPNKVTKSRTVASPYPRPYLMPNCSCKQSARTAIFDYNFKQFACAFCDSMKKLIFHTINKNTEPNSVNVQIKDDQKNESCVLIKEESPVSVNISEKLGFVKSAHEKPEWPDVQESQLNISDISTSIPISFTNQFLKQDSKITTVNQNVTSSSSVPSNIVANKYSLLLQPVKTDANANTVPVLPVRHDLITPVKSNQSPAPPVVTSSVYFNNKSKPPILMRKTSTGLIIQNTPSDSSNFSALASNRLVKVTENSSSHISNSLSCDTTSDRTLQSLTSPNSNLISNANSSASTPVVTVYKVGGNFVICKPMMSSAKPKTVIASKLSLPQCTFIASNALSSAQLKPVEGPVITSVQSVGSNGRGKI